MTALNVIKDQQRSKRQRRAGPANADEYEVDYIAGVQRVPGDRTYFKIVWKIKCDKKTIAMRLPVACLIAIALDRSLHSRFVPGARDAS